MLVILGPQKLGRVKNKAGKREKAEETEEICCVRVSKREGERESWDARKVMMAITGLTEAS